jgi:hypothetical protein
VISMHFYVCLYFALKGQCHKIFLLQVFFLESSFSKPLKIRFRVISNFFKKLCLGIFASQGTPLVQHRWETCTGINKTGGKFAEEGSLQISSANSQICRLTKFVKFANLPQVWHLWICDLWTQYFLRFGLQILCRLKTSTNLQILYFLKIHS